MFRELKINPVFRDLIPPLTDAEATQLEQNILRDGKIFEPIVTWNGYIVDGHHRYAVAKLHKEIPFEVREMDFADEYEAKAWACANQLGRRNLNDAQKAVLLTDEYEARKMTKGSNNQYVQGKSEKDLRDPFHSQQASTVQQMSERHNMPEGTLKKAIELGKGINKGEEISPGFRDRVITGAIKAPKHVIKDIRLADDETAEKMVSALESGDADEAKKIFEESKPAKKVKNPAKVEEPVKASVPVTQDDVIPEGMKKCIICGRILSESEFYHSRPGQLRNSCKYCFNKRLKVGGEKKEEPEEPTPYNADDLSGEISALAHQTEMALDSFIGDFGYVIDSESAKNKVLSSLDEIVKAANKYAAIVKEKEI